LDPAYPILHYSQSANATGHLNAQCGCRARMERPVRGLRGGTSEDALNSTECSWKALELLE
jgi:hypothetical protein